MKRNNKKGQAALEFLSTYGFAFLIILVMIGALAYFGVLNPAGLLPERCTFGSELACDEFLISSSDGVSVVLVNQVGRTIEIDDVFMSTTGTGALGDPSSNVTGSCVIGPDLVGAGDRVDIFECGGSLNIDEVGQRQRIDVRITYTPTQGNLPRTVNGQIFASVQD